jgi:hypothetical protein
MSTNPADEFAARKRIQREKHPVHIGPLDTSVWNGVSQVRHYVENRLKLKTIPSTADPCQDTDNKTV